jgi:hypothetical protein|tara:strand:- start:254 stop:466 length:213 start_codon:yes stop_codon:yes gene_type:complete
MTRLEEYGDLAIRALTYVPRLCIGVYNAVERHMPSTLECNYEIKKKEYEIVRKKEDKNGTSTNTKEKASG